MRPKSDHPFSRNTFRSWRYASSASAGRPASSRTAHPAAVLDIVLEEVLRCHAEERLACRAVLREEGVVGLRHPLMIEDVVEHALFVDRVVPADGLVEHHEKEAVQRL